MVEGRNLLNWAIYRHPNASGTAISMFFFPSQTPGSNSGENSRARISITSELELPDLSPSRTPGNNSGENSRARISITSELELPDLFPSRTPGNNSGENSRARACLASELELPDLFFVAARPVVSVVLFVASTKPDKYLGTDRPCTDGWDWNVYKSTLEERHLMKCTVCCCAHPDILLVDWV